MNLPRLVTAASLALLLPGAARAQVAFEGVEFQVNTYTVNEQKTEPARSVARSQNGGFVAVWSDSEQDGDGTAVMGQRFDAAGAAAGTEFQVNTYSTDDQTNAAVAMAPDGRFVVIWESDPGNVVCADDGDCQAGEFCNVNLRCDGSGQDGGRSGIYGRLYDAAGSSVTGEFLVNTYTPLAQADAVVAMDHQGGFMVAWEAQNQPAGFENDVYAQIFDSTASPVGGEFRVNTTLASGQRDPAIGYAGNGNFIVAWESGSNVDSDGRAVAAQRLDAAGIPVGTEFLVNTYEIGDQINPVVTTSRVANGMFAIIWESIAGQDGDGRGVFGQRFDGSGVPMGTEFQANSQTTGDQEKASVAMDGDGSLLVGWQGPDVNEKGVYVQAYDASGAAAGAEIQVNTETHNKQVDVSLATDGAGAHVAVWESSGGHDGDNEGVFAQLLCGDEDEDGLCDPRCPTVPLAGCLGGEAGKSKLQLSDKDPDDKDILKWGWKKGDATTIDAFGDPVVAGDVDYLVCIYDESGDQQPVVETHMPPLGVCDGKPCWGKAGAKGYKYKDKLGSADGMVSAVMVSGDTGKARITLKGKGAGVGMPTLPLDGAVTAQFVAVGTGGTACWVTEFSGSDKASDRIYKASGP